jgi:hypothetical protein
MFLDSSRYDLRSATPIGRLPAHNQNEYAGIEACARVDDTPEPQLAQVAEVETAR